MKIKQLITMAIAIMVMVVGTDVYSQSQIVVGNDTIVQITDSDFEAVFDKYTAKASQGINNLLSSIKENFTDEAEYVWGTYTKKYVVTWWGVFAEAMLFLIITLIGLLLNMRSEYLDEAGGFIAVFAGIAFIILSIICLGKISDLLVPEYHVIQDLLGIIK